MHKPFSPAAQVAKSYLTCKVPGHSGTASSPFSRLKEAPAPVKSLSRALKNNHPLFGFLQSCVAPAWHHSYAASTRGRRNP